MLRGLPLLQLACCVWLAGSGAVAAPPTDAPSQPRIPVTSELEREAARLGIPPVLSGPGGWFDLVLPGAFPQPGTAHQVVLRLPYYIARKAEAPGRSWKDAQRRLAETPALPGGRVLRLPSEAELRWAHAQRALPPALDATGRPCGEWCADWFAPWPRQDTADPVGPRTGSKRVVLFDHGRRREARAPDAAAPDVAVRRLIEIGWRGRFPVEVRIVDPATRNPTRRTELRLRVIRILDRLVDRQAGRPEVWTPLEGTPPLSLRMLPGRYYFVAYHVRADGTREEGPERKVLVKDHASDDPPVQRFVVLAP